MRVSYKGFGLVVEGRHKANPPSCGATTLLNTQAIGAEAQETPDAFFLEKHMLVFASRNLA